jgi:Nif-specific regulatory protein
MSDGKTISLSQLPITIKDQSLRLKSGVIVKDSLSSTIADIEKTQIVDALKKSGWKQARAARVLGMTPRQIGYKIKRYGIEKK